MTGAMMTDPNLVLCPKCSGQMFDNRASKKNPKAPDYKCRTRSCEGVIWPPKGKPADITPIMPLPAQDKPKLTKLYLDATEFVIDKIVPMFEKAEIPLSDTAVIAAVATIFIAASKER